MHEMMKNEILRKYQNRVKDGIIKERAEKTLFVSLKSDDENETASYSKEV